MLRRQIARCKVTTAQGEFKIKNYNPHEAAVGDVQKKCGVNIDVEFEPPTSVTSKKIGFVQVMKVTKDGQPYLFKNEKPRATTEGWTVDRLEGKKQGYYGMKDNLKASESNYWAGSRKDAATATDAKMHDKVSLSRAPGQKIDCEAITYAVDIEHGTYLGAFSWGWSIDDTGTVAEKPVAAADVGSAQREAIKNWNKQAGSLDLRKRNTLTQAKLPLPPKPTATTKTD